MDTFGVSEYRTRMHENTRPVAGMVVEWDGSTLTIESVDKYGTAWAKGNPWADAGPFARCLADGSVRILSQPGATDASAVALPVPASFWPCVGDVYLTGRDRKLTLARLDDEKIRWSEGDFTDDACVVCRLVAMGQWKLLARAGETIADAPAAPLTPRNLADECGALATENAALKIENSDLRREIDRLTRRAR